MVTWKAPDSNDGHTAAKPKGACPRCETRLIITYDEPECLTCGFADYSYIPPTTIGKRNMISTATMFVFRYIGDEPKMAEKLAYVQLRRIGIRVVYDVTCPFCPHQMEQSSLSGKRSEPREERYRCPQEHRISLIPKKDGGMGWK